jgi:hypothetical protein
MSRVLDELKQAGFVESNETLRGIAARKIDAGQTNPRYAAVIIEQAQADLARWERIVAEARAKCLRESENGLL